VSYLAIPAIILAAGSSSRLGSPKQAVEIGEETLLERTARVAAEAGADPILVVLGANSEVTSKLRFPEKTELVLNEEWQEGVASSIRAGMKKLQSLKPKADALFLLVCDQPAVTADHLKRMMKQAREDYPVASSYAGTVGTPAIFPRGYFESLLALKGDVGARSLLRNPLHPPILVALERGDIDIDTIADLKKWQRQ
jgi:CTP:molybdopterin cytidylyltransferase MocA